MQGHTPPSRRRPNLRSLFRAILVLGLLGGTAAPNSAQDSFDHSRFESLLAAHVTPSGLVDYDAFAAAPAFALYLDQLARVGGDTWTLDEIEHEIIRKRFQEPRIHFALVCAAIGCPPLRAEAYTGQGLDRQLDEQGRRFLTASPEKNRVDVTDGRVYLSPIFDWYREDFPEGRAPFGQYLARFFEAGAERTFLESGAFDIKHTDYDWSLNIAR